jgi:hypothetical protein
MSELTTVTLGANGEPRPSNAAAVKRAMARLAGLVGSGSHNVKPLPSVSALSIWTAAVSPILTSHAGGDQRNAEDIGEDEGGERHGGEAKDARLPPAVAALVSGEARERGEGVAHVGDAGHGQAGTAGLGIVGDAQFHGARVQQIAFDGRPTIDHVARHAVEDHKHDRIGREVDDADHVAQIGDRTVLVAGGELHQ